jgi:hypothetical protein
MSDYNHEESLRAAGIIKKTDFMSPDEVYKERQIEVMGMWVKGHIARQEREDAWAEEQAQRAIEQIDSVRDQILEDVGGDILRAEEVIKILEPKLWTMNITEPDQVAEAN